MHARRIGGLGHVPWACALERPGLLPQTTPCMHRLPSEVALVPHVGILYCTRVSLVPQSSVSPV